MLFWTQCNIVLSGEATGEFGGVWTPHCPPGPLTRFVQNRWENIGFPPPPPRNVVPANTFVLVAHLVTLSESQWNQFHPRAKKLTASWDFSWPPPLSPLLCPWTPLGTPLHSPHHVPLVSHLLQNSTRTNSQNDHLIITFVTNHYICNKCSNEVNFYICTKFALL